MKFQEFLRVRTGFNEYIVFSHVHNPSQTDYFSCGMFTLYLMDRFTSSDISTHSVFNNAIFEIARLQNEPIRNVRIDVYMTLLSDLETKRAEIVANDLPPIPLGMKNISRLRLFIARVKQIFADVRSLVSKKNQVKAE